MRNTAQKLQVRGIVSKLLLNIPPKNREVLARRFGLGGKTPETLESIGESYKITRERVRQIQEYGLRKVVQSDKTAAFAPIFAVIKNYIQTRGGVAKADTIFQDLVRPSERPALTLVLKIIPDLVFAKETDDLHARYGSSNDILANVDDLVVKIHRILSVRNMPMMFDDLVSAASEEARKLQYSFNSVEVIRNILELSKKLKKGPFSEYGLAEWPSISPRSVRDKARLVFEREKRPLHFREVATLIDKYFVPFEKGRATHAQTVHNELIKDPHFVLIGRGLYGLSEWGYEPGTVKDVLVQILKTEAKPMTKEELFEIIAERRFVKQNTVFLNLQNKNYFKKIEDGKYYLA